MKTLDKRLTRLENEHGAGSQSGILTACEKEFLLRFIINPPIQFPKSRRISETDIDDSDFFRFGRFPWRKDGKSGVVILHLWYLRFCNRMREESDECSSMPAEDWAFLEALESIWKRTGGVCDE